MEAEMEAKLFNDYERLQYDIKFDVKNLLRVDLKSQSEYYRTMFNIGVYSINEIRNELDLNQIQN
jgi:hypothetical protein